MHSTAPGTAGRLRLRAAVALVLALCASLPAAAEGLMGLRAAARAAAPRPPVTVASVTAVRHDIAADQDTFTFELSAPLEPTAFVLADPDRIIVDLPQVDFEIDAAAGKTPPPGRHAKKGKTAQAKSAPAKAGLVSSFRFGLLSPGRSRIVMDLAQPARIVGAAVRKTGGKTLLVVELAKTDRTAFRAAARNQALAALSAPDAPAPTAAVVPGKATIVLDPGHGGPDTGAIVNGVVEKDVALAFAKLLAGKLESTGHFNVVMTRADDVFIPLADRVHVARNSNAALMISIHADTLPETADVSGATVYTVSDKASDAYAAKVAAKENEADAAVGIDGQPDTADVNDILFDLTRQETRLYSHVFARTLVNYWKVAGRLNKNPQRAAGFVVLKAPDVPSVLLELGYLSSAVDSASLTSDDWREKATGRMAEAVEAYFADQHGPAKAQAGVPMALKQDVAAKR